MNLTAAWDIPLVFFIENNLYAVSTTVEEATGRTSTLRTWCWFRSSFATCGWHGSLAVHLAMQKAGRDFPERQGPVVVEAEVYRFFHQNGAFPGSAFGYRTKEEEAAWRRRDPLLRMASEMMSRGLITQQQVDDLRQGAVGHGERGCQLVEQDPDGKGRCAQDQA